MNVNNNIIIVEDDKKQAEMIAYVFSSCDKFNLVATVSCFDECMAVLEKHQVDIAIVDIDLSEKVNGIDVVRHISENYPEMQVVINTVYEDSATIFEALKAGAHGYILKGSTPVELFAHIEDLAKGNVPMTPRIARRVLTFFRDSSENAGQLSDREIAVLDLADGGYTYQQIADSLNISRHTVHAHFKQIYLKLKVSSKSKAVKKAKKLTII